MYGCMPMIVHGPKVSAEFPQCLDYNDLYIGVLMESEKLH